MKVSRIVSVDSGRRVIKVDDYKGQSYTLGMAQDVRDFSLPQSSKNQRVIIKENNGEPYIVGYFPDPGFIYGDESNVNKSEDSGGIQMDTSESIFHLPKSYRPYKNSDRNLNFRRQRPYDLIPGDIGWKQPDDGNLLGVLRGLNVLKVSEICQIIQNALNNKTTIVSDNMDMVWGGGVIKFENINNRTRLIYKIADRHIGKARSGKYDMQLEIGDTSDNNFISLRFTTKEGKGFYVGVDRAGRIFMENPTDLFTRVAEERVAAVGGTDVEVVGSKKVESKSNIDVFAKTDIKQEALGSFNRKALEIVDEATDFTVKTNSPDSINLGGGPSARHLINEDFITPLDAFLVTFQSATVALGASATTPLSLVAGVGVYSTAMSTAILALKAALQNPLLKTNKVIAQ